MLFSDMIELFADIASPRSVRNFQCNSKVCVAAVDVFEQNGYQVFGTAQILVETNQEFDRVASPLKQLAGPKYPI